MEDYQERVVAEKKALEDNIKKLATFINSAEYNNIDGREAGRLQKQYDIMILYASVLNERILNFK